MYMTVLLALVGVATCSPARRQLPHETDCAKYYVTTRHGRRVGMICPYGTLFDYKSQACKLPALVQCTTLSSITTALPAVSTDDVVSTTMALPMYIDYLPNQCPVDHRFQLLLPHERDCSLYYQCSYGDKVLRTCPSGYLFSYESQDCLEAYEADCSFTEWTAETESTTEAQSTIESRKEVGHNVTEAQVTGRTEGTESTTEEATTIESRAENGHIVTEAETLTPWTYKDETTTIPAPIFFNDVFYDNNDDDYD